MSDQSLRDLLDEIASPEQAPAGGFVAACSCAQAAALLELTATLAAARLEDGAAMTLLADKAKALRSDALAAAGLELTAYADAVAAGDLSGAADPPLAVAQTASQIAQGAAEVAGAGSWPFTPDAVSAAVLAEGVATIAALTVAANLSETPDDPRLATARDAHSVAQRARAAAEAS